MSNNPRPLLLGYIRTDVLRSGTELPRVEAQLQAFAHREEFSLGTVYVARGDNPGAFDALMGEVTREEAAWGVVVPDLRHVTVVEQLVLTRHEAGARTAVLAANVSPRPGGPGAVHLPRQVCRSTVVGGGSHV
ncbi:hypothetical protein DDE18_19770 [Nocardioides gansuensis]|uniref:Resolvase/invertase-type recombinase catalytic domain-containing protein n=1 Tax=Nocardioides gansuensis TaxID=2138300 RepID=A0A2T8F5T3_9ACTN|nr:hypothetical protein [Nocardioides gansuensis]PVG81059.1 hypothetical protein DDE18_19770 [Nocardioides gansuensis]